ncbi:neuraminidase-like domain-containing protein [Pandoraea oxalativorans]|uniref:Insecticidal toxin complex protein TcaB2 n=1 Tax=Pandoraea oxalativorans TaxID=573737 RepID=A0A0E3U7X3_9BURK|nr:neuraminidase-like domain-containing protein [Pandoraea oxalativorans]AKC70808.1 hypothetical protein MB84_16965 [Pandoraea oxalativorans]
MNDIQRMNASLAKARQSAMVDFYLGQVVVNADIAQGTPVTPADLSHYHLLDHEVEIAPTTSVVAELIASLQRYIHGAFAGEEPGFVDPVDPEVLDYWRNWESRYDIWSGAELLRSYPENYLDPTLRLSKSGFFRTLETDLHQARLNKERARAAILTYLRSFEHVANLDVVSGYIDGLNFRDAPYFFIGKQKTAPPQFFWRRADVTLRQGQTSLSPTTWGEWQAIGVKMSGDVTHIRPVCINGRLFIVWVERLEIPERPSSPTVWRFTLKYAYLDLNGLWSPAEAVGDLEDAKDAKFNLLAMGFESFDRRQSALAVALVPATGESAALYHAWDPIFDPITLTAKQIATLKILTQSIYQTSAILQSRAASIDDIVEAEDLTLDRIEVIKETSGRAGVPGFASELSLGAAYFVSNRDGVKQGHLDIEARCYATRFYFPFNGGRLRLIVERVQGPADRGLLAEIDLKVLPSGKLGATLELGLMFAGYVTLQFRDLFSVTFDWRELIWERRRYFEIDNEVFKALANLTQEECLAGAGFTFVSTELSDAGWKCRVSGVHFSYNAQPFRTNFSLAHEGTQVWSKPLTVNGGIAERSTHGTGDPTKTVHTFSFGATDVALGRNTYKVHLKAKPSVNPTIVAGLQGSQFLEFAAADFAPERVRLNTTFSGTLIQRASVSLEHLLGWDAQNTPEPPFNAGSAPVVLDFNGANGRYFWEIFFHLPHLVANQLKDEMSHEDALEWLNFLFDPGRPLNPGETDTPRYWRVRPLIEDGDPNHEISAPADPDAIAYSAPVHYRKRIFRDYVETLVAWADMLYRQVSRDSLTEAKMLYLRASRLMGQAPVFKSAAQWTPSSLTELDNQEDTQRFAAIEAGVSDEALANLAPRAGGALGADLLAHPAFRLPLNTDLLSMWETLASRLSNLRNHLTIDGKPLQLPLFDPPIHPTDLLRAQAADGGFHRRDLGNDTLVLPYRFMSILPRAQQAVNTLCRFGDLVRQYMEQGDRTEQETLLQQQLMEMSQFTLQLQEEMLRHAQAVNVTLRASRDTVHIRYDRYKRLYDEDLSPLEILSNDRLATSRLLTGMVEVFNTTSKLADLAPNIFGTSSGGARWGSLAKATVLALDTNAKLFTMESASHDRTEAFRRRRAEWAFQRDTADAEMRMIDTQIAAQEIQIEASRTSLAQQTRAMAQAEEMYTFLSQTRGSKTSLYRWLLSRTATFYFQAYDATNALCLAAQAGWQYEIGDYDTNFIQPGNWFDNYYGLTAGEALSLTLLKMESSFLHRHERRLVVKKIVSIKTLLGEDGWNAAKASLKESGAFEFPLTSYLFDEDHPGLYLRQLRRVAVTLPAVIGPYQTLNMTLTQTSSLIVVKPDIRGVQYVYDPTHDDASPENVRHNLRLTPQVAISEGLDDDGTGMRFLFDNDRYEPFERMGAISTWQVAFPRHGSDKQMEVIDAMSDLILHIEYTAVDGGADFAAQVEDLMKGQSPQSQQS